MLTAAVSCFASNAEHAGRIVTRLKEFGFRRHDISVLLPQRALADRNKRNALADTAASGLAWLAKSGELTLPDMGQLKGSGPIMAAMVGTAVAGSPIGGVTRALELLGMSADEAEQYEQHLRQGQV